MGGNIMRFKKGALAAQYLREPITSKYPDIQSQCDKYGVEFVITSGVEGRHKSGSKHYDGLAIDMRSREFNGGSMGAECAVFCEELRRDLGLDYDVVQEGNHIHIEYDTK